MNNTQNRLQYETSPYLLQHANNPVDWYPWCDEAFSKAKQENKLVLVSIGYSSCHWCHVMEHEAFSNPEVTSFMNKRFINIKVDREERPDIDQIYMNAVQIITRRGGWPLNCFALPNGKPVFGGTYFKAEDWLSIIKNLNDAWEKDPTRIEEVADELAQSIEGSEIITFKRDVVSPSTDLLIGYAKRLKRLFDNRNGGIIGAPKFPMPALFEFLLEYGVHANDDETVAFVHQTLNKISEGGIYDHIGGGFARYSVDEKWQIPHFEKMLYDNAQLISLYSKAFRNKPEDSYRRVVKETIDFVLNEMKSSNGGIFASYDADSEGKEGAYYTWRKSELESILGYDAELFSVVYGVTASGNFDGSNVLYRNDKNEDIKQLFSLDCSTIEKKLNAAKAKLKEARNQRVKPSLDDKIILSWNAMFIDALVEAYITFGEANYLEFATELIKFVELKHLDRQNLKRIYCKEKLNVDALLDDYAYLTKAYISLYKVSLNQSFIDRANQLVGSAIDNFFDKESGMFFYSSNKQNDLIARKMDLLDGVMTSSGSLMAQNLKYLGELLNNESYKSKSLQMLANIEESIEQGGPYVFGWARLILLNQIPVVHLKVPSTKETGMLNVIQQKVVHPFILPFIQNKPSESQNKVNICIGNSCYPSSNEMNYYADLINSTKLQTD